MTPEQAGWAIVTGFVIFGGELMVWFQGHLDRSRRAFVRAIRSELRSRARRGGSGEADRSFPRHLSDTAGGVARGPDLAAPSPAPSALAGAPCPRPDAPARPQRQRVAL